MEARKQVKAAVNQLNRLTERAGVRVQPVHYYSEVPDRAWLREHPEAWNRPTSTTAVPGWDLDQQLAWLGGTVAEHLDEVRGLHAYEQLATKGFGPGYGPIESQILHCTIRHEPPARVVEIGSGLSTAIMSDAIARNRADSRGDTHIVCIEPFPYDALTRLDVELVEEPAQTVDLAVFEQLGPGDLLFVDSTHTVRTGSDVLRIFLEIVPALRAGVRIHVHDIYLPYLFRPNIFTELFDWQESSLLMALLIGNRSITVDACLSALFHDRLPGLRSALPDLDPLPMTGGICEASATGHFPSSTWLRTRD